MAHHAFGTSRLQRLIGWFALVASVAMTGCAALPTGIQRAASHTVVDARTTLAQTAAAALPGADATLSGARLIADGDHALAARIALIRRAERSIDLQTYQLASDGTGARVLRELRDAAARGVRVRLLIDDLYAAGQDELFGALAADAHIEVRLFNPLPVRNASFAPRIAMSLHEFSRINRRMHNKLFIADGALAIAGGRNVADEYYLRSEAANFVDMDVLLAGAAVRELGTVFDAYWNSEHAYPIGAFTGQAQTREFDALSAMAATEIAWPQRDRAGRDSIPAQLERGALTLSPARVQVLADDPAKATGAATRTTRAAAAEAFAAAQSQLTIVSPYFVPGASGMEMLQTMQTRGVRVSVTTNSLGATDEPLVHAGYAKYRLAMLRMGVKLHEMGGAMSRKAGWLGDLRSSSGRLHAKLAVIDQQRLFIGSMNMDGRSERFNTELGLLIDSRALATEVAGLFEAGSQRATYQLRLTPNDDGRERIEWVSTDDDGEFAHIDEPDRGGLTALKLSLLSALISEDLL
ncbi:MAG TPA: phospholipase D family protein [Burkholderiaceae bacterium]|nr:phospholipase D family protein [Burkholderiaceae bacterium]